MANRHLNRQEKSRGSSFEIFSLIFKFSIISVIFVCITTAAIGYYFFHLASGYDLHKVEQVQHKARLLDRHGIPLIGDTNNTRLVASPDELPQHLLDALTAREDESFYQHKGVDILGLGRATLRNIKDLSFTQGASTISMQLARNTYEIRAKSIHRKLLEIALTLRIENHYSKKEILLFYLNKIYFGSGSYGINAAAHKYFNKPASQLSIGESATLVGIVRGPHLYSPLRNPEGATEQRNQVLDRMYKVGSLDLEQTKKAKAGSLVLAKDSPMKRAMIAFTNGYALQSIDRELPKILKENDITSGELTINSTLDLAILDRCDSDIQQLVIKSKDPNLQAACVVIDNYSGAVRAIIGGINANTSEFNRAIDGRMDLGAAFYPLIYTIALEHGKHPIVGKPQLTMKQLNTDDSISLTRKLGLGTSINRRDFFSGSLTASPLQIASAYSSITNEGAIATPYTIESITYSDQSTRFQHQPILTEVLQAGTARQSLKIFQVDTAANTFSFCTQAFSGRALWAIGANENVTFVLWLGHDNARAVQSRDALLENMQQISDSWLLDFVN